MRAVLLAILISLRLVFGALAQAPGDYSAVTLDGGGTIEGQAGMWASLSVSLAPGWKTYWRNPGDAGIAPVFDWSGSVNLKAADIVWPAPKRFSDGYSNSIGYAGPEVVLPVRIEPEQADRPVVLTLTMHYAACEVICIPEKAELSGFVRDAPAAPADAERIRTALAKVPATVAGATDGPHVAAAGIVDGGEALEVAIGSFDGAAEADLFALGPEGEAMLMASRIEDAVRPVFRVPLDGIEGSASGRTFHFTVVWPEGAFQQSVRVD